MAWQTSGMKLNIVLNGQHRKKHMFTSLWCRCLPCLGQFSMISFSFFLLKGWTTQLSHLQWVYCSSTPLSFTWHCLVSFTILKLLTTLVEWPTLLLFHYLAISLPSSSELLWKRTFCSTESKSTAHQESLESSTSFVKDFKMPCNKMLVHPNVDKYLHKMDILPTRNTILLTTFYGFITKRLTELFQASYPLFCRIHTWVSI